jgi:hypothetical protein
MTDPYKEAPATVALADYEKLQRSYAVLDEKLAAIQRSTERSLRWAQRLRTIFAGILIVGAVCCLGWLVWWGALQGHRPWRTSPP